MSEIEKLQKALNYAYGIIHGTGRKFGLIDCLDAYYSGTYDSELARLEKLIQQTQSTNSKPKTKC